MSVRAELQALAWLTPWAPLAERRASELGRTFAQGLSAHHPLASRAPQAVAARDDTPDTLFVLAAPEQLCLVQLTKASDDPAWPQHTLFDSVEDFVEGCMRPDHLEETDHDV